MHPCSREPLGKIWTRTLAEKSLSWTGDRSRGSNPTAPGRETSALLDPLPAKLQIFLTLGRSSLRFILEFVASATGRFRAVLSWLVPHYRGSFRQKNRSKISRAVAIYSVKKVSRRDPEKGGGAESASALVEACNDKLYFISCTSPLQQFC